MRSFEARTSRLLLTFVHLLTRDFILISIVTICVTSYARMDFYVFLGKELGGRPNKRRFYCDGVADYKKMAQASEFKKGLDRVIEGAKKYRIALMCSERDPSDCHRCLLVGRALATRDSREAHSG